MGLNINQWVTFCIAAAAASYYQNTDRTVQTQHSWLHGFSGCVLMIFCDIKSGKRWLYYYYVCCILLVMYSWLYLFHYLLFPDKGWLSWSSNDPLWSQWHQPRDTTLHCEFSDYLDGINAYYIKFSVCLYQYNIIMCIYHAYDGTLHCD